MITAYPFLKYEIFTHLPCLIPLSSLFFTIPVDFCASLPLIKTSLTAACGCILVVPPCYCYVKSGVNKSPRCSEIYCHHAGCGASCRTSLLGSGLPTRLQDGQQGQLLQGGFPLLSLFAYYCITGLFPATEPLPSFENLPARWSNSLPDY